jgi:hypothetical protein
VIAAVVELALARAMEALPYGALGIRCHALPVDEDLKEVLAGVEALLAKPGFEFTKCVIGSAATAATPPRTYVLQTDLAAAEATRIRNDPTETEKAGFRLIYLNSGSTPGEAGLDVLVEVRAQALARYYAETAGLEILAETGASRARAIVARLEDTTVETLARYATTARDMGELSALPTLGFLPRSLRQDRERPNPQWVTDFDTITSGKLTESLVSGVRKIVALGPQERDRFAAALIRTDGLLPQGVAASSDPIASLTTLATSARRFALGQEQDPAALRGLSRRLLDVLRSDERISQMASGTNDDDEAEDGDEEVGDETPLTSLAPQKEERIVAAEGAEGLVGKIDRFEVDDGALEVVLRRGADDLITIAPSDLHTVTWQTLEDTILLTEGAAVEVAPEAAILGTSRPVKFKTRFTIAGIANAQPELQLAREKFLARRADLVAAVGRLLPPEEAPRFTSEQRSLLALEAIPLTCLANANTAASAYVAAYVAMMSCAYGTQEPTPIDVDRWLTHLDTTFSIDSRQSTVAARLQPLHPLRIARSLLWLEKRAEPPMFPSLIVSMTGYAPDALYPHGERHCYHARPRSGPSREGIEAAVRDALMATWSLLAPHGLMSALDVELIDVVNTGAAVEALYRAAAERFAADATVGAGVHLRVRCAYSEARGPTGIVCPKVADLPELAGVAGAIPGNGVTVEILPQPVLAGSDSVHLAVQAVEAPFHGLQPSAPTGWGAKYIPGQSGNIIAVELTGNAALDGYRRLLSAYNKDTTATFDPGLDQSGIGRALVKTYVAAGGWPVRPSPSDSLLSYDVVGPHVIATLIDGVVFDAEVANRLEEFSVGGASAVGDMKDLREGLLGLFPCRNFLADLLGGADSRGLLGWLGILRAFKDAQDGGADVKTLTLSLDSPEGRAWVRSLANVFGTHEGRADLLILEANSETGAVTRIRAVELKARTSAKQFTTKASRAKLATQAIVTASRLREVLGESNARVAELRDSLRRLVWLGAGQQRAALQWKKSLEQLDEALLGKKASGIAVKAECWLVPEELSFADADSQENMPALDVGGEPTGSEEIVRVRVLQPVSRRESQGEPLAPPPGKPPAGSSSGGSPPGGTTPLTPEPERTEQPMKPALNQAGLTSAPGSQTNAARTPDAPVEMPHPAPVVNKATASAPPGLFKPGASPPPTVPQSTSSDGLKVTFGQVLQGTKSEATWLPNRTDLVTHFNLGITGTMGSGKTQFTKSLLAQICKRGADNPGGRRPGILIFDYKGDYVDTAPGGFAHAVGARVLKPHRLPLNPLRLKQPESALDLKLAMRQFAETIKTIATATGDVQRLGIIQAIEACLQAAGIDEKDPSTWSRPFPTLTDLHARLAESNEVEGVPFAVIHDLADFEIFAPEDPGVELDAFFDDITVIDLRPLAGADKVIRAVLSFFMNAFFARMIQQGESLRESRTLSTGGKTDVRQIRRLLLVDEADDFIGLNLPSLKNVMQQGRAFGYGVVLSTQFLHHFDSANSPLKPLIGTWVLHRMADIAPGVLRNLFGLSNDEGKVLANTLNGLEVHTSMCFGLSNEGSRRRLTKIRDLPFFEWINDNPS